MIYIGIDPGKSGGIAMVLDDGRLLVAQPMPETDAEVLSLLRFYASTDGRARGMIERVSASPGMGVSSAFKFGGSYHSLRMALTAVGIPYDDVHPRTWTQAMGVSAPKGESRAFGAKDRKPRDKNISKIKAQQLFPTAGKITHATAEALLIAEYARRLERGTVRALPRKRAQRTEERLFR